MRVKKKKKKKKNGSRQSMLRSTKSIKSPLLNTRGY